MTLNNNLSILPFYNAISDQNHRKDYAFGEIYPLYCPDYNILPFQFIGGPFWSTTIGDYQLALINLNTGVETDLTSWFAAEAVVTNYATEGYTIIRYPAIVRNTASLLSEGRYYLRLYDDDSEQTVYSEVVTVVAEDSLQKLLVIEYSDGDDLIFDEGRIEYTDFVWKLYLPTQLGKPEYPFTEELQERDGYSFFEKQISEKTFKFTFLAPEFLLDAMRVIRLSDNIAVGNKGWNRLGTSFNPKYEAETFLITPTWEDGGWIASVEAEFQCDTIVKKIGKTT